MIEPLISLMNAHRVYYNVGQEFAAKPDVEDFLGNMSSSLQRYERQLYFYSARVLLSHCKCVGGICYVQRTSGND